MPRPNPDDLQHGLMIHTVEPVSERMTRWKSDIEAMTEAELVLASALISVRRTVLEKARTTGKD